MNRRLSFYPYKLLQFICMYSYIGTYGNADPLDVQQWQQLGVSVPTPTRRFDARTGICTNMFTGIYFITYFYFHILLFVVIFIFVMKNEFSLYLYYLSLLY